MSCSRLLLSRAADAVLVAHSGDPTLGEIDLEHVLRRTNRAHGTMGPRIEYFSRLLAVFTGCDVGIVAVDVKGKPMRSRGISPAAIAPKDFLQLNYPFSRFYN